MKNINYTSKCHCFNCMAVYLLSKTDIILYPTLGAMIVGLILGDNTSGAIAIIIGAALFLIYFFGKMFLELIVSEDSCKKYYKLTKPLSKRRAKKELMGFMEDMFIPKGMSTKLLIAYAIIDKIFNTGFRRLYLQKFFPDLDNLEEKIEEIEQKIKNLKRAEVRMLQRLQEIDANPLFTNWDSRYYLIGRVGMKERLETALEKLARFGFETVVKLYRNKFALINNVPEPSLELVEDYRKKLGIKSSTIALELAKKIVASKQ